MWEQLEILTAEQVEQFNNDGYLVLPDALCADTISKLKKRIGEVLEDFDPTTSSSIFSTGDNQTSFADDYFFDSAGKISYFWEEDAWDNSSPPKLKNSVTTSINKIGHALHDLDAEFQRVSYHPKIGSMCRDLGMKVPLAAQSMYIFKQPRIGGPVCPHQDGTYLYTEPQSVIGFWWALDDCTPENGCLWAVPGSHKAGVVRHYRRTENPLPGQHKTEYVPPDKEQFDLTAAVPVEVKQGTLVILHGAVVHYSEKNTSDRPRHAYSIHVIDGAEGIHYSERNWLQRPSHMPFREIK